MAICGDVSEAVGDQVFVALDARCKRLAHQSFLRQRRERAMNIHLLDRHDGVARRLLVGRRMGRVERQRIDVWRRFLLLDQASENAGFNGIEDGEIGIGGRVHMPTLQINAFDPSQTSLRVRSGLRPHPNVSVEARKWSSADFVEFRLAP